MAETIDSLLVSLGLTMDEKSFQKAKDVLHGVKSGILELGAAAGIGMGFKALTSGIAETTLEMSRLSKITDFTMKQIDGLRFAMRKLGLSPEAANQVIQRMPDMQQRASLGELGTKAYWSGKFNPTEFAHMPGMEALKYLADAYGKMNNNQRRTLRQGLGVGDNDPLTRLLEGGHKWMENSFQEFNKIYKPIDTKLIDSANDFNDQMAQLHTNFENLSREIGGPLLKNLNSLLKAIDDFYKEHPGLFKTVDNIMSGQWYNDLMADASKRGIEFRNYLRQSSPVLAKEMGPMEDENAVKPDKANGGYGGLSDAVKSIWTGSWYGSWMNNAATNGAKFRAMAGGFVPEYLKVAGAQTKPIDKTADPDWVLKHGQPSYIGTSAPSLYNPVEPVQHAQAARRHNSFSLYEQKYRLPAGLLNATYQQESGGGKYLVSPKGALGPFGIMPGTARDLGLHGNDVYDLNKSSEAMAKYYRMLIDKYHGDLPTAVAAYNWGMGNVDKFGLSSMPKETRNYLPAILKRVSGWHGSLDDYASAMSPANSDSFAAMQNFYALMGTPPALPAFAGRSGDHHVHQTNHIVIHAPGGDPAEIDRRLSQALTTHSQQAQDMLASDIF